MRPPMQDFTVLVLGRSIFNCEILLLVLLVKQSPLSQCLIGISVFLPFSVFIVFTCIDRPIMADKTGLSKSSGFVNWINFVYLYRKKILLFR